MDTKAQRRERRDRSRRYGAKVRREHRRTLHTGEQPPCICNRSVWSFRKAKVGGCRCRATQKGAPKLPGSRCHWQPGGYNAAVSERIRGKRLARTWLMAAHLHDVEA